MRANAVYLIERLEEGIYVVVAVLLAVAAVLLLVSAGKSALEALQGALDPYTIVLTVLDKGLVLLNTKFQWNPEGIQLLILVGLILVMAIAIGIWRRSERLAPVSQAPEA